MNKYKQTVSEDTEPSWTKAAMLDTKQLNSEDFDKAKEAAPVTLDENNILGSLYSGSDIPKLPFKLERFKRLSLIHI